MAISSLLFDLDGTLLDTEPGILGCLRHTIQAVGFPLPPEQKLREQIGPPLELAFQNLLGANGPIWEAVEIYRQCYEQQGQFQAQPYPGIRSALQTLSSRYLLLVATSKRKQFAEAMLEHFALAPYFKAIYGVLPDNLSEPKASLIGRILHDHTLRPEHTAMVGDRVFDRVGAEANGVHFIGALWGYGNPEELAGGVLCSHPWELAALVTGLPMK